MSSPIFINLYPEQIETFVPEFSTDEATFIFGLFNIGTEKKSDEDEIELLELGNSVYINLNNITEVVIRNDGEFKCDLIICINNIEKYKVTIEYEFEENVMLDKKKLFKYQNILKDLIEILYMFYITGNYQYLGNLSRTIKKYQLDEIDN